MTVLEERFMQRMPSLLHDISESLTTLIGELQAINEKLNQKDK